MAQWLSMGGYGWYVWSSYGIFGVILAVNWYAARKAHRQALRKVARYLERRTVRK